MNWLHAILLGIVEGITEFLPISSTGHLTFVEKLLHYNIEDPGITAFTAIIQVGAIIAAILYFWKDIVRFVVGWFKGLRNANERGVDYRLGWAVIIGSLPVMLAGFLFRHAITGALRNLWVIAAALALWGIVMLVADRIGKQTKHEEELTWKDTLVIGIVQCFSLIPGVSRSGATIAAGLIGGLDRVAATRFSFFLGIPALCAAGLYEGISAAKDVGSTVGWGPTALGTLISFVVAYASIAWLLKFVQSNNFTWFVVYRVALALGIVGLLVAAVIQPV